MLTLATLAAPAIAMAAPPAASTPVASERSFPATRPHRSLRESTSTDNTADWGGIESLDVPYSKSQAEKNAESHAASRNTTRSTPAPAATTIAPASITGDGADIARYALEFQGSPYVYGGTTPAGWDCSGFTAYIYGHFGVRLPHQSEAQQAMGTPVSAADAQPGDLLWRTGHVGIYLGNGMMIHASTPDTGTIVTPVAYGGPYTYYRLS